MVILLALKWWYSAGWQWAWKRLINERINWINQAFSISALVRTWFSPFKQTYSNAKKGSIDLKVQAMVDNLVSRLIGSLLRTLLIFTGLLFMLISLIFGLIIFLVWPFVPFLPVIAIFLSVSGFGV